jgi:serine/threonine-protein kinase
MAPPVKTPRVEGATSIAVLPFKDLSSAKDQSWLCEGVADEVLNALARLAGLRVTPRDSAFVFAGAKDLRAVAAKLKVATVLTGSVRPIGDQVRITVEFSDVVNGVSVWSGLFDCELRDLLKVEGHIAKTIAEAFILTTAAGEAISLPTRVMVASEAHCMYLKGRALAMKRGRLLFPALQHFQKAIEGDPDYALAWAGVAEVCCLLGYYGLVRPDQYRRRALSAAERAVEIDPQSAEAHDALACSLLLYQNDPHRADLEFQKALELNPGHSHARCLRALLYLQLTCGRHDEAIAEVRRALNSDPHSPYVKTILGLCLGIAGQHDQALSLLRMAVNADPEALLARHALAYTLYWAGKFDEAESVTEGAGRMSGYSGFGATMLVMARARLGRLIESQRLLGELQQRASSQYVAFTNLAEASFAIGDRADAVALAGRALEDREPQFLLYARHAPHFAWLREETGWPAMLRQLEEPQETSS